MWHTPYPYLNDPTRPELAQPEVIVIVVIAGLAMLMLLYALGIHWDGGSKLRPRGYYRKETGSVYERPTSVWKSWVGAHKHQSRRNEKAPAGSKPAHRTWARPL